MNSVMRGVGGISGSHIHELVADVVKSCGTHSNSLTISTDSLVCLRRRLSKQLSDLPLSKTCVAHLSDIVIEHTRVPQW